MFLIADAAAWPLESGRDQELLSTEPTAGPWLLPLAVACEAPPPELWALPVCLGGPDGRFPALVSLEEGSEAPGLDPITGLGVAAGELEPVPLCELPLQLLPDGITSAAAFAETSVEGAEQEAVFTAIQPDSADGSLRDLSLMIDPSGAGGSFEPRLAFCRFSPEPFEPWAAVAHPLGELEIDPLSLEDFGTPPGDRGGSGWTDDGGTLSDAEAVAVELPPTERLAPRLITDPVAGGDLQPVDPSDGGAPFATGVVPVDLHPTDGVVPQLTTDPVVEDPQSVTIADVRVHFTLGEQGWAAYLYSIGVDGQVVGVLVIASYDEPSIARFVQENRNSGDGGIVVDRGDGWLISNFPLDQAPPVPDQGLFSPAPGVFSEEQGNSADAQNGIGSENKADTENNALVICDPGIEDPSFTRENDPTYAAYLAFLKENPLWLEQNGADGSPLQVVTASVHLPWIELETPGAAQAFDLWCEQIHWPQQVPLEGSEAGWGDPVVCTFLAPEEGEPLETIDPQDPFLPIRFAARGEAPSLLGASVETMPWINARGLALVERLADVPPPAITADTRVPGVDAAPMALYAASARAARSAASALLGSAPASGGALAAAAAEAQQLASPADRNEATPLGTVPASRQSVATRLASLLASDGRLASDESQVLLEELALIQQRSWLWRPLRLAR